MSDRPDRIGEQIDALFAPWTADGVPGGAVGVLLDGAPALHRTYGLANIEHGVPINPDTRFHIASVTKQIVAAALVLLEARGRVSLDDPVAKHFPQLRAGGEASLRQLLNMTAGLRDTGELMRLRGVWYRYPRMHEDMLELLQRQTTPNFPSGERYIYTNIHFGLAGSLIERLVDAPLDEALRRLVFDPLFMADTLVRDANTTLTPRLATGYIPDGDTWEIGVWSFGISGAGSVVSTIPDLLQWQKALLRGEIAGTPFARQLAATGSLNDGTKLGYGQGLDTRVYRGVSVWSHGGSLPGYKAMLALVPDLETGFVLLANRDDADPNRRYRDLLDILLDGHTDIPPPVLVAEPAARARLEGRWLDHASGELLTLTADADGVLQADKLGYALHLQPDGERRWRYDFGHFPVRLVEGDDSLDLYFGGQRGTFQRLSSPPTDLALDDYVGTYSNPDLAAEHDVWHDDGRLIVRQGPACHAASTFPLEPLAPDIFHLQGGRPGWLYKAALRFERNAEGRVTALHVSTDRLKDLRLERRPAPD
ncbi:MAG: serine hydrolase [Pseudomonadota bacterium]